MAAAFAPATVVDLTQTSVSEERRGADGANTSGQEDGDEASADSDVVPLAHAPAGAGREKRKRVEDDDGEEEDDDDDDPNYVPHAQAKAWKKPSPLRHHQTNRPGPSEGEEVIDLSGPDDRCAAPAPAATAAAGRGDTASHSQPLTADALVRKFVEESQADVARQPEVHVLSFAYKRAERARLVIKRRLGNREMCRKGDRELWEVHNHACVLISERYHRQQQQQKPAAATAATRAERAAPEGPQHPEGVRKAQHADSCRSAGSAQRVASERASAARAAAWKSAWKENLERSKAAVEEAARKRREAEELAARAQEFAAAQARRATADAMRASGGARQAPEAHPSHPRGGDAGAAAAAAPAPDPAPARHGEAPASFAELAASLAAHRKHYDDAMAAEDVASLPVKVVLSALRFRGIKPPPGCDTSELRALFVAKRRVFAKEDRAREVREAHRETIAAREAEAERSRGWREQYAKWFSECARLRGVSGVLRLLAGGAEHIPLISAQANALMQLASTPFGGLAGSALLAPDEARVLHRKALLRMHPDKHARSTAEEQARAAEATAWLTANKKALLGET